VDHGKFWLVNPFHSNASVLGGVGRCHRGVADRHRGGVGVIGAEGHECEGCSVVIPAAEYGVMLGVEEHWRAIAPRPDDGFYGSGLLCLDCNARLRERVGGTFAESLAEDYVLTVYGKPTARMMDVWPEATLGWNRDMLDALFVRCPPPAGQPATTAPD
jgi:hypothetical protein